MKAQEYSADERSRLLEWVGLGVLVLFTAMAVGGYWTFGLHPNLIPDSDFSREFYGLSFRLFARAHIVVAGIVLAVKLYRHSDIRWVGGLVALALASEAGVTSVLVLTKLDRCSDPQPYIDDAQSLDPGLSVVAVNSLDPESAERLLPWCDAGNTVVFLGSSGVGKSTLVNSLFGESVQLTHDIREDDDKGRHTTTGRTLHLLPQGGMLLDTPGMRELQLVDVGDALEDVFAEITGLAASCRFSDCTHDTEPGCAVIGAIESGDLDPDRLKR